MSTSTVTETNVKPKYKYLTKARIDSTIKKHGLEVVYTKGQNYFYFLDLKTGDQVGDSIMVARLHHLTIQQWRDAAAAAREGTPVTATQEVAKAIKTDAAKIRKLIEELDETPAETPVETWDEAVEATERERATA